MSTNKFIAFWAIVTVVVFVSIPFVMLVHIKNDSKTKQETREYVPFSDNECPCDVKGWNNERIIMECQCTDNIGPYRCNLTVYNTGVARSHITCDRRFGMIVP